MCIYICVFIILYFIIPTIWHKYVSSPQYTDHTNYRPNYSPNKPSPPISFVSPIIPILPIPLVGLLIRLLIILLIKAMLVMTVITMLFATTRINSTSQNITNRHSIISPDWKNMTWSFGWTGRLKLHMRKRANTF